MMEQHTIGIGISDYLKLRAYRHNYFVDKSLFIQRVLTDQSEVQLFPRPRRFGKTLNLTMLKAFVERELFGSGDLWPHEWAFDGLQVMQEANLVAEHAGKYPVIFLTFKDVKMNNWQGCLKKILMLLATETWRHLGERNLDQDGRCLSPVLRQSLSRIIYGQADAADAETVLLSLAHILSHITGQKAMILIDEYDTPILSAWTHGYYDDAITFFRTFLGAGLKDNPYLAKGVLTGILRIAKESVFSDLNNLTVYSLLLPEHADSFGFTQTEVDRLLTDLDAVPHRPDIIQWYNGYLFGDVEIYNPWSILNCMASRDRICRPYWLNTSSNDLVRELIMARADSGDVLLQQELTTLLAGGVLSKAMDDHIVLRDIRSDDDSLWSLLAMSGYLKVGTRRQVDDYTVQYDLAVPNMEVMHFYRHSLWQWTLHTLASSPPRLQALLAGLLDGDMDGFEASLKNIVQECFSFHDVGGKTPERFYHAFFLGLLLQVDSRYEVTSNRESGMGRYDIALIPRTAGQRGIIIELKKAAPKTKLDTRAQKALEQARSREYVTILQQRGADPLVLVGIALRGKEVAVRWEATAAGA